MLLGAMYLFIAHAFSEGVKQKINFLISLPKHMLWVCTQKNCLKLTMRRFFWAPKTYAKKLWVRKY